MVAVWEPSPGLVELVADVCRPAESALGALLELLLVIAERSWFFVSELMEEVLGDLLDVDRLLGSDLCW